MTEEENAPPAGTEAPSEDEIRAQLEDEIRKVKVEDVVLQSVISILNLCARRIAKEDERDLEQAKLGIETVRAIVELLPAEAQTQVREALTELQLLYAKHASGDTDAEATETVADGDAEKPDA